jgi:hypothetical protein
MATLREEGNMKLTEWTCPTVQQKNQFGLALSTLLGISLLMPSISHASEIATNMVLSFNEAADFDQGIDKFLTLNSTTANARFLTNRLGTFSGGNVIFTLNGHQSVSINDPGVDTLPDAPRNLLRVYASSTASGALLTDPASLTFNTGWSCTNTSLKCSSNTSVSTPKSITPATHALTDIQSVFQPIHLQATATVEPLVDNVTINSGQLHVSGTVQVNVNFTAKTTTQYAADALAATSATTGTLRWGAAAADIQLLRKATWTDAPVASNLQASRTPGLEEAQRLLTVAHDSATLLATGNAPGTSYNSGFALTQQLWNLTATVDPALGRSLAGSTGETFSMTDVAAEVGVLRSMLNGATDSSFVTDLEQVLNDPLGTSSMPVLTFDGSLIGLANATMSVFYVGDSSGRVEIELGAASRYAFWRTAYSFDRVAFLEGAAEGVTVIGGNNDGVQIRLGEEQYVGEVYNDELFYLSGNQTASRLKLNNFYNNQLLVVASWAVTPVPEPSVYCLMLFGLVLIGRMKKIT